MGQGSGKHQLTSTEVRELLSTTYCKFQRILHVYHIYRTARTALKYS